MARDYLNPGFPYVELYGKNGEVVSSTSENALNQNLNANLTGGNELKNLQVIPHYFQQLVHETRDSGGQGTVTLKLFDPTFDQVENFVLQNKETMAIRYGWFPTNGSPGKMSPIYKLAALTFQSNITTNGSELELKFGSAVAIKSQKTVRNKRFVDMTVSDIVRELLLEVGYAEEDITIEPTRGLISVTQPYTSVESFIKWNLANRAVSAITGRQGYVFKVEGQTATFCTRGYRYQLVKRFIWRLGQDSDVISFSPAFVGQHMLMAGGAPIEVGSHDVLEKRYRRAQFFLRGNPAKYLSLGLETHDIEIQKGREEALGRYYAVPFQNQEEVETWAAWKWVKARQMAWRATSRVMGDPSLVADPNFFVEFQVVKPDGQLHYLSGKYGILRATHAVDGSGYFTDLELITDGSLKDEERTQGEKPPETTEDLEGSDSDQLSKPPGEDR